MYVFDLNELEAATATLQADSGFGIASDYGWGLLDRGDDTHARPLLLSPCNTCLDNVSFDHVVDCIVQTLLTWRYRISLACSL